VECMMWSTAQSAHRIFDQDKMYNLITGRVGIQTLE